MERWLELPVLPEARAGGEIKIRGHGALEQRILLKNEAVKFRGRRIDMSRHESFLSREPSDGDLLSSRLRI